MSGDRKSNFRGYTYSGNYPWHRAGYNGLSDMKFVVSPAKDCVIIRKESSSLASTRYFKCVSEFEDMRDQLRLCMDEVEMWNDMDIPDTAFSIPISVICNMGSLRMHIRGLIDETRLSRNHCKQLLFMFDTALRDLDEWNTAMREIYGEKFVEMPRYRNG